MDKSARGVVAVVDAGAETRAATADLLDALGFTTLTFAHPAELLAAPELPRVDVVLSDLHFPGMTGLRLLHDLGHRHPAIAVVILAATPDDALRRHAFEHGAFGYLVTPVEPEHLLALLSRALGGRRQGG